VPAAAVIPSLIAFYYVAAVKMPVAVYSSTYHFEKLGAFIADMSLDSTAKHDIGGFILYAVHGSARSVVFNRDR